MGILQKRTGTGNSVGVPASGVREITSFFSVVIQGRIDITFLLSAGIVMVFFLSASN